MKSKIFLYLFVFAALYIVFQYMNAKKANEYFTKKVERLETRVDTLEAENKSLVRKNLDLSYFSLTENDNSVSYIQNKGFDVEKVAVKIKDKIREMKTEGEDHPLIPFPGLEGKMRINHIEILNARWILADFTDGVYWGEVLLVYYIDEEGNIDINTLDGILYGRRGY